MFEKRTDLALEVHELRGKDSGITVDEQFIDGVKCFIIGDKGLGKTADSGLISADGKLRVVDAVFIFAGNRCAEKILADAVSACGQLAVEPFPVNDPFHRGIRRNDPRQRDRHSY